MLDEPMNTKQMIIATVAMVLFAVAFAWFLFTFVDSQPIEHRVEIHFATHCHLEDGSVVPMTCEEWMR